MPKIRLTIDRFEGEKAVLVSDDGLSSVWPRDWLPADTAEGQVVYIDPQADPDDETARRKLARSMLNELLNTGKDDA